MTDLLSLPAPLSNRALWTIPLPGEVDAPGRRIIHTRGLHYARPVVLQRVGVRQGTGYFKCGSVADVDWITDFRLSVWCDGAWQVVFEQRDLPRPAADGTPLWFDLPAMSTSAVLLEARRSGIEEWWPSWNIAGDGFVLEGVADPDEPAPPPVPQWQLHGCTLEGLPQGVSAERLGPEVRYRTPFLEVGFRLRRAACSYLALDDEGEGRTQHNLLRLESFLVAGHQPASRDYFTQGVRLHLVGQPVSAGFMPGAVAGTTEVRGNMVRYEVQMGETGVRYRLEWEIWRIAWCCGQSAPRTGRCAHGSAVPGIWPSTAG